jgi:hypothetical protein
MPTSLCLRITARCFQTCACQPQKKVTRPEMTLKETHLSAKSKLLTVTRRMIGCIASCLPIRAAVAAFITGLEIRGQTGMTQKEIPHPRRSRNGTDETYPQGPSSPRRHLLWRSSRLQPNSVKVSLPSGLVKKSEGGFSSGHRLLL